MAARVAIVMGSDSDWPVMRRCRDQLKELGIEASVHVMSAHRSPERVHEFAVSARDQGLEIIIAAAGMSAALSGCLAAATPLPVIGVPMASGTLGGLDALLSTVQMPPGVPVAGVSLGEAGAVNAAVLAARILGLADPQVAAALDGFRERQRLSVQKKDQAIREGSES